MFEEDDKYDKYETFDYKEDENLNFSQSYTRRMIQKKQLERKKRKGNIWISRLHILLRLLILSGIFYSVYLLSKAPQWYVDKYIFTTSSPNLEIINNKIVPSYKILNELRKIQILDEPIYRFETDKIRLNLLELEPIENVYIKRYWFPARLKIIVRERTPIVSIYLPGSEKAVAFFTEDGVLIGEDYLPLPEDIKTIKVVASGDFREWDKTQIDEIRNLKRYLEQVSSDSVECINMSNVKDVYIKLNKCLLRIGVIDESVYERTSRIASIIPELNKISEPVKYVDLRWQNVTYIKTE